jgi:hypothetical protein
MCFEHYGQSETFESVLEYLNISFIAIFTLEFFMKLIALNYKYFMILSNTFDFIILVFSIAGIIFDNYMKDYFSIPITPTLLRVIRLVRFGHVLRSFQATKGIRAILSALVKSIPGLVNIGLLLFLIIYIYAIFGMNLFMNVGYSGIGLTKEFNFENIYRSVLTLFPLCTSGGFSVLLDSLTHEAYPFCEPNNGRTNASYFTNGNCGRSSIAIPFLVSYVVIAFFVVINLYVAIILENFDKAKEELQKGKITEEDLDHYYQVWQIFDPRHSKYIKYEDVSDFVDSLYETGFRSLCNSKKPKIIYESPLRIPKPNADQLVSMDIILCANNMVYCEDLLEALTKYCLGHEHISDQLLSKLISFRIKKQRAVNYRPVGSTLKNMNPNSSETSIIITTTV